MNLSFTDEELAFREEARRFFRTEIPQSIRDKTRKGEGLIRDDIITSQRILNARGWATVNWPLYHRYRNQGHCSRHFQAISECYVIGHHKGGRLANDRNPSAIRGNRIA